MAIEIEAKLPQTSARAFMGWMPSPLISNNAPTTVPRDMLPDESLENNVFIIVVSLT